MNTTDKLAEALRLAREWFRHEEAGEGPQADDVIKAAYEALAAHDAEQEPCHDAWRAALAQRREPLTVPHPGSPEAKAMIDSELAFRDWPANHFNAARAGYEACRKLAGLGIGATTGEQR